MLYLATALVFFILSVVIHIVYCRAKKAAALYAKHFVLIALVNLILCGIVFYCIAQNSVMLALQMTAIVIYLLLVPAYLIVYVTTGLESPSKTVLKALSSGEGVRLADLQKKFSDEEFIVSRLSDLVQTNCAEESQGRYRLAASGKILVGWLRIYEFLLGKRVRG